VHFEAVFLVLFSIASAVAIAAKRLKIPYTVALVATGLVLGLVHVVEAPHLTRQLLYTFILPGLLFEASFHLDLGDFWKNRLAIPMLAVPGVLATILLTAAILASLAHGLDFMRGFTFAHGLIFGAVIAATDPIAVVGLFRALGAPKRLRVLVEGESLLNDGTALVLFGLVLELVSGAHPTAGSLALAFFKEVGAGALTGVAVGTAVSRVIRSVDDPMIEITLTTIAAYGSFVAAEAIGGSGVIATVTAGMLCGNYAVRSGMNPSTRIAAETFWEYAAFALNSIVFLLVGFELRAADLAASWAPILVAYVAMTAGRSVVILSVAALLRRTRERIPWPWTAVLTWAGLRGALSMVLALSLAADVPQRSLLVTMTFGVVLLTILIQGSTMSPLMKRAGLVDLTKRRNEVEIARGRAVAARAALSELERMQQDFVVSPDVVEEFRARYATKADEAERALVKIRGKEGAAPGTLRRDVRRHILVAEKAALIAAADRGLLGPEPFEEVVGDVDARLLALDEEVGEESSREGAEESPDAGPRPPKPG